MCEGDRGPGARSRPLAKLLLVVALGTLGCSEPPRSASGSADRESEAALDWSLAEDYRVGGVSASGPLAFGDVAAVAFGPDGHLYVIDADANHVVVIDRAGRLVRTLGESGEGPGSLAWPTGLVVYDDGEVVVLDSARRRWVRFGPEGDVLDGVPLADDAAPPRGPLALDASGRVVGTRDDDVEGTGPRLVRLHVVRSSVEVDPVTLWSGWRPITPEARELTPEETGGLRVRLPPLVGFHPHVHAAPLPDGRSVVSDSTDYRLRVLDPSGAILDEIRMDASGTTVTEAHREAEKERRRAALEIDPPAAMISNSDGQTMGAPDDPIRRLELARIDAMGFHDRIPVIAALAVEPEGRLWVGRSGASPGDLGPIDVFSADLELIGTLPPGAVAFPAALGADDLVAHVTHDDFGAPIVHVSRWVRR